MNPQSVLAFLRKKFHQPKFFLLAILGALIIINLLFFGMGSRLLPQALAAAPSAPVLTAAAGDGSVALSWTAPTSNGGAPILNYMVLRGTISGVYSDLANVLPGSATTYTNSGLTNGATYYFAVVALNGFGQSTASNQATATPQAAALPAAPGNLSAAGGNSRVDLSWTAPNFNNSAFVEYRIYRATCVNNACGNTSLEGRTLNLTFADINVINGTTYAYAVAAVTLAGEGPPSNTNARPQAPTTVPGTPANLTASAGNSRVDLSWTAPNFNNSAFVEYRIYRATCVNNTCGAKSLVGRTLNLTFGDILLTNGTTYAYAVSAVTAAGEGLQSSQVSATPLAPTPTPSVSVISPNGGESFAAGSTMHISWSAENVQFSDWFRVSLVRPGTSAAAIEIATALTSATRAYTWIIPSSVTPNNDYEMTVSLCRTPIDSICGNGFTDYSNAPFSIVAPAAVTPSVPTNLTASAGNSRVDLSWTAPNFNNSAFVEYRIYRGICVSGSCGVKSLVGRTLNLTFGDILLTNGTTYAYAVSAVTAAGEGLQSSQVSATPQAPTPTPSVSVISPNGGESFAAGSTMHISWSAENVQFSDWFRVSLVRPGTSAAAIEIATALTSATRAYTWIIPSSVTPNNDYEMTVSLCRTPIDSICGNGFTDYSNAPFSIVAPAAVTPSAPANLTATPGDGQVTLVWTAPVFSGGAAVTAYNVYLRKAGETYVTERKATVSNPDIVRLTYTGLLNDTQYYFIVKALNSAGESPASSEVNATPQAPALVGLPTAPTNLTATPGNGQVTLFWSAPTDSGSSPLTGYNIYARAASAAYPSSGVSLNASQRALTYGSLTNDTKYYFVVKAMNAAGESPASSEVNATPQAPSLTPALTVTAPNGGESFTLGSTVTISWLTRNYPEGSVVAVQLGTGDGSAGSFRLVRNITDNNILNSGGLSWTVPADLAPGNNYIIRINVIAPTAAVPSASDDSDAPFSIISALAARTPVPKPAVQVPSNTTTAPAPGLASLSSYPSGTLLLQGPTAYLVYQGKKSGFSSFRIFQGFGFSLSNVVSAANTSIPDTGHVINNSATSHPWGSWIASGGNMYFRHQDGLIPVPSLDVMSANGGRGGWLVPANSYDLALPQLPVMQAADARLK